MSHGTTSYSNTQFAQICREVIKALPQALHNIIYEDALKVCKNGQSLESVLNQAFLAQLEKIKVAFSNDKTRDGWKLIKNTEKPEEIDISSLELIPFLKDKETSIKGEELVKRAKKLKANLGQYHAEYLLEHQEDIPEDWRDYYIVFPGTIWRGSVGFRNVSFLYWGGSDWSLRFAWLDHVFASFVRLLRFRD